MATAQFTPVVNRDVDDVLTEAIWDDQIRDNVNQLGGAHQSLLVDGGFERWSRGNGGFTANGYTTDRWYMSISGAGMTVTRETSTVDSGEACAKVVIAAGPPTFALLSQYLEDATVKELRGETIAWSVRVHQSVASQVSLQIVPAVGALATSATLATTGQWVTLTLVYAVDAAETDLSFQIHFGAAGTYYVDNAMLVIGPAPAPYRPLHPADYEGRCGRYHLVLGAASGALGVPGYAAAGALLGQWVPFPVTMGGTPTLTKNGTWSVANCGQPTALQPNRNGFLLSATVTALGTASFQCDSTDDNITAEWNP